MLFHKETHVWCKILGVVPPDGSYTVLLAPVLLHPKASKPRNPKLPRISSTNLTPSNLPLPKLQPPPTPSFNLPTPHLPPNCLSNSNPILHLLKTMFYFPLLVLKRNLSLLEIMFIFSWGLNQIEVWKYGLNQMGPYYLESP